MELAPPRVSAVVGQGIELLAAIPSIIYGMWGLFVLAPPLQRRWSPWWHHRWSPSRNVRYLQPFDDANQRLSRVGMFGPKGSVNHPV